MTSPLDAVAVALDTDDQDELRSWSSLFGPRVGYLKVGLSAYVRWGPEAVRVARRSARGVFLDLKLHDIPNTVGAAVRGVRELGVDLLTVHTSGGPAMLEAAVEAAGEQTGILGVTVLTHLDEAELDRLHLPGPPTDRVVRWARLAVEAGCLGIVASPRELPALREALPSGTWLVTPGIRGAGEPVQDQRRVATAAEAIARGADLLVVGRPLTRCDDPVAALERLGEEISRADHPSSTPRRIR